MDWLNRGKRLGWNVLDWLIPPSCVSCGTEIAASGGVLCGDCFAGLRFIHAPFCDACAIPITQEEMAERGALCAECEIRPPAWYRGRAAFLYERQARTLLMGLKYGGRTERAAALASFMSQAGDDLLVSDGRVLIPVPVHRGRLWQRGYNQAALIANHLARRRGLTCYPDALHRQFRTAALAGRSRHGRYQQMAGAITVRPRYRDLLRGRSVVVVDDILTTGATAEACAKALLEHECISVDILVTARVTLT